MTMNRIDLKSCPFCGKENTYSEFDTGYAKGYVIRIGCNECNYALKFSHLPENERMSLKEVWGSIEQAAEKWNTRSGSDKI